MVAALGRSPCRVGDDDAGCFAHALLVAVPTARRSCLLTLTPRETAGVDRIHARSEPEAASRRRMDASAILTPVRSASQPQQWGHPGHQQRAQLNLDRQSGGHDASGNGLGKVPDDHRTPKVFAGQTGKGIRRWQRPPTRPTAQAPPAQAGQGQRAGVRFTARAGECNRA